jgi:hypothetical protein
MRDRYDLIGKNDAEIAHEGELSSALVAAYEVTTFETKWFALQVLKNELSITSKDALSGAKDLAVGIFQLVPHTPVKAVVWICIRSI